MSTMKRPYLPLSVFLLGLAVVAWVALAHATANPFALATTLLIGIVYVAGARELQRYRKATATLAAAVDGLGEAPADLAAWLGGIDASLRGAVRLRIAGERTPLPAPALPGFHALLTGDAAGRRWIGLQARERNVGAAVDALAVCTVLHALQRGLDLAQLARIARDFGDVQRGLEIGHGPVVGLFHAVAQGEKGGVVLRLELGCELAAQHAAAFLELLGERAALGGGQLLRHANPPWCKPDYPTLLKATGPTADCG